MISKYGCFFCLEKFGYLDCPGCFVCGSIVLPAFRCHGPDKISRTSMHVLEHGMLDTRSTWTCVFPTYMVLGCHQFKVGENMKG